MSARTLTILKRVLPAVLVVAVVCVGIALLLWDGYEAPPMAYEGSSEDLKETVIVPTLDTPMPKGKNVIWCASFQLAWNEFRDDVIGEPLQITGAQEIADRLNASPITADVLDPDSHYAAAGYVKDGVVEQIGKEMAARFPDVPKPHIPISDLTVAVAYSYLQAEAKFTFAFDEYDEEWTFGDVPVRAFGVHARRRGRVPEELREQVKVLYCSDDPEDRMWLGLGTFAIDPCRYTTPYQIILARVERRPTLAETLASLDEAIAGWEVPWYGADILGDLDVFLAPSMIWRLEHHFGQIEGVDKLLLNPNHEGNWIENAIQRIDFRLVRSGAELKSEAVIREEKSALTQRHFLFNRPFLIVMKKRGAERPFLVMWVENAELLCKPR